MAIQNVSHQDINDPRMSTVERDLAVDVVKESIKPYGYVVYAWEPYIKLVDQCGVIVPEDEADKILREGAKKYWQIKGVV